MNTGDKIKINGSVRKNPIQNIKQNSHCATALNRPKILDPYVCKYWMPPHLVATMKANVVSAPR